MLKDIARSAFICILLICIAENTAMGITLKISSSEGPEISSSAQSYDLDRSTKLKHEISLDAGKILSDLNAAGEGDNKIMQSISGSDYILASDISSRGTLSISASSSASGEEAEMSQDVAGVGSLSIDMQSWQSNANAGQEASVDDGILSSSQSLYAGKGQGAFSQQVTDIEGHGGNVASGALGEENVMLAEGSYYGQGSMKAVFASAASERAVAGGFAFIDDVLVLSSESMKALSSVPESAMMGVSGLRMLGDESDTGSFDVSVLNFNQNGEEEAKTSGIAASTIPSAGGSYSSYRLMGYRWNKLDPQIQLYLNPTNMPADLTSTSSQNAISEAANTWEDAVASNLFKDANTVIVDGNKVVDDPFSSSPQKDGYNVHGWRSFGNSFVALNRWWTDGTRTDGYYNIIESDTWYNLDYGWTADLATAETTSKMDLQSVALHELGHCIGLGDIYSTTYGGVLPPSDERTRDFDQVMNLYNGPQRLLGNGDITGAQTLYGKESSLIRVGSGRKT
jgi:predicted Zn-dependent protease